MVDAALERGGRDARSLVNASRSFGRWAVETRNLELSAPGGSSCDTTTPSAESGVAWLVETAKVSSERARVGVLGSLRLGGDSL
jgi:hypothetical protein